MELPLARYGFFKVNGEIPLDFPLLPSKKSCIFHTHIYKLLQTQNHIIFIYFEVFKVSFNVSCFFIVGHTYEILGRRSEGAKKPHFLRAQSWKDLSCLREVS